MERNAGMLLGHPSPAPPLCWSSCLLVLVPRRPGRARRRRRRLGSSSSVDDLDGGPGAGVAGVAEVEPRKCRPALELCTFDPLWLGLARSGALRQCSLLSEYSLAHDDQFLE